MTASIVGWAHTPFGKFDTETVESLVVKVANEAIAGIQARGRLPILAGGTGLYLRAVLQG